MPDTENISQYIATSLPTMEQLIARFKHCKAWDSSFRELLLLSKNIPTLPEKLKNTAVEIAGCESKVWLYHYKIEDNHFFVIDSEAKIIKGLLAVLLVAVNGLNDQQLSQFMHQQLFTQLGLSHHLSPSRGNGLAAVASKIKSYAL